MSRLQFNKDRHLYTLDGKPITGVTTILGVLAKPALIQWAADMAIRYIKENSEFQDLGEDIYYRTHESIYEEARKAHTRKKEQAADIGTLAHKWIENWIKGNNPEPSSEISIITDPFVKWATDNKVKFLASEKQVYSENNWYAGTLDFICEVKGLTFLGDIKTSSAIYDEMFWQTSAYQAALQEMVPDYKIDGHIILNCRKNGGFDLKESYDYKKDIKAFLGALEIYRRQGELKKLRPKR